MREERRALRVQQSFSLWVFAMLAGSLACRDRAADEVRPTATAKPPVIQERALPAVNTSEPRLSGAVDVRNRYLAVVRVSALFPPEEGGAVECSGVLVGRRLVLTAGQCVCRPRAVEQEQVVKTVVDGTACAAAARVMIVRYEPPTQGEERAYVNKEHKGRVLPHPEFKVELDEQQRVVTRRADVALILLDRAVGDENLPLPWDEEEVGANAPLVLVGYGEDEADSGFQGQRRSNRVQVLKREGDQLVLEQPGARIAVDDRGGPCLRETAQGLRLAGISNRRSDQVSLCTSLSPYRGWLQQHLQRVGSEDSSGTP